MEYTDTYLDRIREAGYDEGLQALCRSKELLPVPAGCRSLCIRSHAGAILDLQDTPRRLPQA